MHPANSSVSFFPPSRRNAHAGSTEVFFKTGDEIGGKKKELPTKSETSVYLKPHAARIVHIPGLCFFCFI